MTGKRFERYLVLKRCENGTRGQVKWTCKCDCGTIKNVLSCHLVSGKIKSCGCYSADVNSKRVKTHGMSKTPTYKSWAGMKDRCFNAKNPAYYLYGGRGITVCESWANSFNNFLEDIGQVPSMNHSLDRINNDGNYEPGNCKWSTRTEQARNRSTNNKITYKGLTKLLSDWSNDTGISMGTLSSRINRGWSIDRVLTEKVRHIDGVN